MKRQHQFASGLTICVFVTLLSIWGILYSIDLEMIGLIFPAAIFYPGAFLLATAIWPAEWKPQGCR